ncbi:MAG TPA: DUF5317 domain-containing protein [Candidatus Limnocylindrales bacterium]|nr:DUF5317 domain-containing protein [Candidatus Limnocylindrales bacterium]
MLLLYAVVIGLVAGLASGGKLAALGNTSVRLWPVALIGLFAQLLLFSSPVAAAVGAWGPSLYVASTCAVVMALVANLRQPGFWLIIAGALLNFAVIIANGGQMPASPDAFAALNGLPVVPTDAFSNSVIAGPQTQFAFLGDNFVLPRPLPLANVFSIGDVLVGAGGVLFIFQTMHGRVLGRLVRPASNG